MADAYLLDNNVISTLVRPTNSRYPAVKVKLSAIDRASIALPIIAIGEIEFGMAKTTTADPVQQAAVRQFFKDHPWHIGIGSGTIQPYSLVRAKLWQLFGTPALSPIL